MSALNKLKFVNAKQNNIVSPVLQRRNKLLKKIGEQIELAKAQKAGTTYAPTRLRKVINKETGEGTTIEMAKRLRAWYWMEQNGKICLSVKYGAKSIELAKGKNAVELGSADEILPTLETIKLAVESGELDAAIEATSGALKAGFAKKKK